jgi:hypothetical protein
MKILIGAFFTLGISVAVFNFFEFVLISTQCLPTLRKNGRHAPRTRRAILKLRAQSLQ